MTPPNTQRMQNDEKWTLQVEATRQRMELLKSYATTDEKLWGFANVFANIIAMWQVRAGPHNPSRYTINFGQKETVNLISIFQLMPEEYQMHILVEDEVLRPIATPKSWLDEGVMNLLIHLSAPSLPNQTQASKKVVFARDLASCVTWSLDRVYAEENTTYLGQQIRQMEANESRESWNPQEMYNFPPDTSRIVFFYNWTEIHWTMISVDISSYQHCPRGLRYYLYNSLGEKCRKSAIRQMANLETLIRVGSDLPRLNNPPETALVRSGRSPVQDNPFDCGIIAVYNALRVMKREAIEDVPEIIDSRDLRLKYLQMIQENLSEPEAGQTRGI